MDKQTESLADEYLRNAGHDPDLARGRLTALEIQRGQDARHGAAWRLKNSLKAPGEKQVGLAAPTPKSDPALRGLGGFLFGLLLGRWL